LALRVVPISDTDPEQDADLEFVDGLPRKPNDLARWVMVLNRLKGHPGRWAKLTFKVPRRALPNVAVAINRGVRRPDGTHRRYSLLPSGIWRAAVRGGELYVCFCGEMPIKQAEA
jgi:hypothetical protein